MTADCIVLASASPRRRELLDVLGVCYEVQPAHIDETSIPHETPRDYACRVALAKAHSIHSRLDVVDSYPVLAADTVVVVDGQVLGKPRDDAHATEMLQQLSGRTHEVYTAVALISAQRDALAVSRSEVTFRELDLAEIRAYWKTGEPQDKAGAYAVQGLAAVFIRELKGSFSGIMGLPLYETAILFTQAGVKYRLAAGNGNE